MRAALIDRSVVTISGPETHAFLQGLITNDMEKLNSNNPLYAALLTPQGKILFDFILADDGAGGVFLDCAAPIRDALMKRLALYRLRAKVEIKPRDDLAVLVGWNEPRPETAFDDPRLAALGWRAVEPRNHAGGDDNYLRHRLELGIPEGGDFGQDRMFALDADLEELHGVSFDKGCYVGQELTARMKHRGTARKRLLPIQSIDGSDLGPAPVGAGSVNIGDITSIYGACGFALLRLDRLDEAGSIQLTANGAIVKVTRPSWLAA